MHSTEWCFNLVFYVTGLGTGAPTIESPYGDTVQPQEAPESISRAVASLPPEQMFELMKQMKVRTFAAQLFKIWVISFRNKSLNWLLKIIFPALKKACVLSSICITTGENLSLHICHPPPPPNLEIVVLNSFFQQFFKADSFCQAVEFQVWAEPAGVCWICQN